MGEIGGDTWGVDDIVEGELVDERAGLEEEREWLADTAGGTCDDCEGLLVDCVWVSAMFSECGEGAIAAEGDGGTGRCFRCRRREWSEVMQHH